MKSLISEVPNEMLNAVLDVNLDWVLDKVLLSLAFCSLLMLFPIVFVYELVLCTSSTDCIFTYGIDLCTLRLTRLLPID